MARKLRRVEGFVWCDRHGNIHEDSLDPYEYGEEEKCQTSDHFAVYARTESEK